MTEEEKLAEEYEMSTCGIHANQSIRDAFLSGLKAGKDMNVSTKWHDLRKNPKDLPPVHGISDCTIDVLTDGGDIAYFDYDENCWCDSGAHEIDPPKAWCEIPKFEEESK